MNETYKVYVALSDLTFGIKFGAYIAGRQRVFFKSLMNIGHIKAFWSLCLVIFVTSFYYSFILHNWSKCFQNLNSFV